MRKKIEAVGNIEAILPDCVSIESDHKRRGRDTVPYTEPGPTTSGLVTKLQNEAEEARTAAIDLSSRILSLEAERDQLRERVAQLQGQLDSVCERCQERCTHGGTP